MLAVLQRARGHRSDERHILVRLAVVFVLVIAAPHANRDDGLEGDIAAARPRPRGGAGHPDEAVVHVVGDAVGQLRQFREFDDVGHDEGILSFEVAQHPVAAYQGVPPLEEDRPFLDLEFEIDILDLGEPGVVDRELALDFRGGAGKDEVLDGRLVGHEGRPAVGLVGHDQVHVDLADGFALGRGLGGPVEPGRVERHPPQRLLGRHGRVHVHPALQRVVGVGGHPVVVPAGDDPLECGPALVVGLGGQVLAPLEFLRRGVPGIRAGQGPRRDQAHVDVGVLDEEIPVVRHRDLQRARDDAGDVDDHVNLALAGVAVEPHRVGVPVVVDVVAGIGDDRNVNVLAGLHDGHRGRVHGDPVEAWRGDLEVRHVGIADVVHPDDVGDRALVVRGHAQDDGRRDDLVLRPEHDDVDGDLGRARHAGDRRGGPEDEGGFIGQDLAGGDLEGDGGLVAAREVRHHAAGFEAHRQLVGRIRVHEFQFDPGLLQRADVPQVDRGRTRVVRLDLYVDERRVEDEPLDGEIGGRVVEDAAVGDARRCRVCPALARKGRVGERECAAVARLEFVGQYRPVLGNLQGDLPPEHRREVQPPDISREMDRLALDVHGLVGRQGDGEVRRDAELGRLGDRLDGPVDLDRGHERPLTERGARHLQDERLRPVIVSHRLLEPLDLGAVDDRQRRADPVGLGQGDGRVVRVGHRRGEGRHVGHQVPGGVAGQHDQVPRRDGDRVGALVVGLAGFGDFAQRVDHRPDVHVAADGLVRHPRDGPLEAAARP